MQTNTVKKVHAETHGGSKAFAHASPIQQLRRSVLSCLLYENEFYESGQLISDRIMELSGKVSGRQLADLAIEARTVFNLRHVSLLLLVALAKQGGSVVSEAIEKTISRADELNEFIAMYWRNGKTPLSKQVKKGLALAFRKFDAYQLAKYDREKAVRLRDVLFMIHAKPKDDNQAAIWKQLVEGTLPAPGTWENKLSAGDDKKATFEQLLSAGQLGYMALLKNLRGMMEAGVKKDLICEALLARKGADKVLPFRFIAAARACPQLEPTIDMALQANIANMPALPGRTVVMVDVSGSMDQKLSGKSDLTRKDAAAALASVINGDLRVFSFADNVMELPPRRGMAGVDAICQSQRGGTRLFDAVKIINDKVPYDRIIVITDEQDTGGQIRSMPNPIGKGYLINVASSQNGVGYGAWDHIDGFSENVIRWIVENENAQ